MFSKNKNTIDKLESLCRQCISERGKSYRKNNPHMYERSKKRHREFMKKYSPILWQEDKLKPSRLKKRKVSLRKWKATLMGRFVCWRKSAKKRGIEWNLQFEDIKNKPLICFYSNETLVLEPHSPNTISLDRIDNTSGYTIDNVVFCGKIINNMKNTQTFDDFKNICIKIANKLQNKKSN